MPSKKRKKKDEPVAQLDRGSFEILQEHPLDPDDIALVGWVFVDDASQPNYREWWVLRPGFRKPGVAYPDEFLTFHRFGQMIPAPAIQDDCPAIAAWVRKDFGGVGEKLRVHLHTVSWALVP